MINLCSNLYYETPYDLSAVKELVPLTEYVLSAKRINPRGFPDATLIPIKIHKERSLLPPEKVQYHNPSFEKWLVAKEDDRFLNRLWNRLVLDILFKQNSDVDLINSINYYYLGDTASKQFQREIDPRSRRRIISNAQKYVLCDFMNVIYYYYTIKCGVRKTMMFTEITSNVQQIKSESFWEDICRAWVEIDTWQTHNKQISEVYSQKAERFYRWLKPEDLAPEDEESERSFAYLMMRTGFYRWGHYLTMIDEWFENGKDMTSWRESQGLDICTDSRVLLGTISAKKEESLCKWEMPDQPVVLD